MNENIALRRVVLKASSSVPLGVRLWCCFKKFVLEKSHVRAGFEVALSETHFRKKMRPLLRKYGPVELRGNGNVRRSSSTAKRIERDSLSCLWKYYLSLLHPVKAPLKVANDPHHGLGLYARKPLDQVPKDLFGLVANVDEEDFAALVDAKYPSLYETGHVMGILFGPLSLVNHSCAASFRFSNLTPRGHPEGFEGFGVIRLKGKGNLKQRKRPLFDESDEILVDYGMRKKGFVCSCQECLK